jgi:uncharacterized protein (UPF0548 family)
MFSFRRPTISQIEDYLKRQARDRFSYDGIGCTRAGHQPRAGWAVDHCRVFLGHGGETFERAKKAIRAWKMFPPEVATLCQPMPPHEGQVVGVLYFMAVLRLWLLFPARVVYLADEVCGENDRRLLRFGFAYGTLPDHPERGEERFFVEWNQADNSVWYDLLAVSQPAHWLARLGYPFTRFEQARFRRLSGLAMQRAVNYGGGERDA